MLSSQLKRRSPNRLLLFLLRFDIHLSHSGVSCILFPFQSIGAAQNFEGEDPDFDHRRKQQQEQQQQWAAQQIEEKRRREAQRKAEEKAAADSLAAATAYGDEQQALVEAQRKADALDRVKTNAELVCMKEHSFLSLYALDESLFLFFYQG